MPFVTFRCIGGSMDLLSQQMNNEYVYCKKHTIETFKKNYVESGFTPYIEAFRDKLVAYFSVKDFNYVLKNGERKVYVTKQQRYTDMINLEPEELLSIAWKAVIWCNLSRTSFTSVVSKLVGVLPHEDRLALETAAEILGVLEDTPFIQVEYPRNTEEGVLMINPRIGLDDEMIQYVNNQRYVLPSLVKPKPIVNNKDSGYLTFKDTVFTKGKHHEEYVNLHHLNRQNAIPLSIDTRVYRITEPLFKPDATDTEAQALTRIKAFKKLNFECIELYKQFKDREFFLTHRYDERLRTYTKGHHFSSQGADYQKGAVELAVKELVRK